MLETKQSRTRIRLFWIVGLAVLSLSLMGQSREDSTITVRSGASLTSESPASSGVTPAEDAESTLSQSATADSEPVAQPQWNARHVHSLLTLILGVAVVLVGIIGFKLNAFLALILAALFVSLMSDGAWNEKITRVGFEFGASAGRLGLVIALAAVIGQSFMSSGCAERIVNFFIRLLGERRTPLALCGSGYVLGIPVFFDTVFYLLVPLARSAFLRTRTRYLACLLAVAAGGTITHTMVPPTPGPLLVASNLGVNIGTLMLVGSLIGVFAAAAGLAFAYLADRWISVPVRWLDETPVSGKQKPAQPTVALPPLYIAIIPLGLPVLLIASATVLSTLADQQARAMFDVQQASDWQRLQQALAAPGAELTEQDLQPPTDMADTEPKRIVDEQSVLAARRVLQHLRNELAKLPAQGASQDNAEASLTTADVADESFVEQLNDILRQRHFFDAESFLGVRYSDTTKKLLKENVSRMPLSQVQRLNRLLLEDALGGLVGRHQWDTSLRRAADTAGIFGDANLALLLAAFAALIIEKRQRRVSWSILGADVEKALGSAGVIILITAAGGAFGAMLNEAKIGDTIREVFSQYSQSGLGLLVLAFAVSSLLKFAQGSSTVAMITASGMMASMAAPEILGCHPVYLATAIGGGSLFGSWMNDSGFWIFAKMGYLTTEECLKTWTPCLAIVGFTGGVMTLFFAWLMPLV